MTKEASLCVEEFMDSICKIITVDLNNGIVEQTSRIKTNILLEKLTNSKATRKIGDYFSQGLEKEQKLKDTTL